MKQYLKAFIYFLLGIIGCLGLVIAGFWIFEWRPKPVEVVANRGLVSTLPDTLKIVSWNIGYAGLGDDMDFFYDGGKSSRTSADRTAKNLNNIIRFLEDHKDSDFILLQEVDRNSKRSYGVDQMAEIAKALNNYDGYFACNYRSPYVPIPFSDPIGGVEAGLVSFSKHKTNSAIRYQLPSSFDFPVSLFNLKRGILTLTFVDKNSDTIFVNNIHNTAYDTGNMRDLEMQFLRSFLKDKPQSITVGDWNSNPPGYIASNEELESAFFSPIGIKSNDFDSTFSFASDVNAKSSRYGYEPYNRGVTTETNIDFALLGGAYKAINTFVIDLGYESSDHHPVIYILAKTKP